MDESGPCAGLEIRNKDPSDEVANTADSLKSSVRTKFGGILGEHFALKYMHERLPNNIESEESNQDEDVQMLHQVQGKKRLDRIDSQSNISSKIRVVVDVIAVDVVLVDVLVNPIDSRTADPVLCHSETVKITKQVKTKQDINIGK